MENKKCERCKNRLNNGIRFCSISCRNKSIVKKGLHNPAWRGDSVKYSGLHMWLQENFGKGKSCESCGGKGKFFIGKIRKRWSIEWANINGIYTRERKNWRQLCKVCHIKNDKNWTKRIRNKLGQFT